MIKKYRTLIIAITAGLLVLISIAILTNQTGIKLKSTTNQLTTAEVKFNEGVSDLNVSYSLANAPNQSKELAKAEGSSDAKRNMDLAKRKIILTGSMVIETNKFDAATKSISTQVQAYGGYVENSEINGVKSQNGNYLENRTANYRLRIPSTKFESFMNQIGSIGVVTSKNSGGEDVTSEYIDSEARVKSLKVKEASLLGIMKKAKLLTDILAIETELENTRYEIENLTGSLKRWDNLVSYSTLTLSLREVTVSKTLVKKPAALSAKLGDAFNSSIATLADLSKGLLVALVAILPFAFILAFIGLLVLAVLKHRKKNS